MPAFSGKHYYTVDEKGRLIIPAPFREILSTHYSSRLFITNAAFDRCLHIYPYEEWRTLEEKVSSLSMVKREAKAFQRFFISGAVECLGFVAAAIPHCLEVLQEQPTHC
jgi:MraZ protein